MKSKQHTLLLGAHTSIADSMEQAIVRGASIGCTTIQIFTKSNRQWGAKPITQEDAELFRTTQQKYGINPIIAHATYLINIGSPDKQTCQKSVQAILLELSRCAQLGIPLLVLHPGSHTKSDERECLDRIIENLDLIFNQDTGTTKILLEIMAGQGSSVCYSFEQLAYILAKSSHANRLGICFDTCHAFAAGYDFRTPETYQQMWQNFDTIIGLKHLEAIHVNDSKKELNSHVDRHESIGKGKLGLEAFRLLFNDRRFFDIPKILETPEGTLEDYSRDIQTILAILSDETKHELGVK